ncbi:hypothetical protein [uncultured Piscinibacter sp.]|uniref:hypothetical protein n=1 Tax=uncultured Piscinibacter sp. TaxID=1131835 RepID=UPI00261A5CE5|nr:hypothetical protein [uncultured Piscinibacter sp.]
MRWPPKIHAVLLATACSLSTQAHAAELQTVCTITVNSADEKESFRRHLPPARYRFVELVERGRPDWLASACREDVSCDVLVVSGHYDGGNEFFSDQLEVREFLTVSELERVSCSGSCPSLFSRLKEVHLFGCNTLNPHPQSAASAEIVRSLVREGHAPKEAKRQLESLSTAHGENSRDRMRQIFKDVPVIYGFSTKAPLGPIAASTLDRYFRAGGAREIGRGHPSGRLLGYFAPFAMTAAQGMTEKDPHLQARRDMCRFADERLSEATKLGFVHELLRRPSASARLYLDRIQRLTNGLDEPTRRSPAVARALEGIARDGTARARFLDEIRAFEPSTERVRMVDVARDLGWLSEEQRWEQFALMLGELQDRRVVGVPEVGLACSLNEQGDLDGAFNRRVVPGSAADDVPHAAMRACLGSAEGRARTLEALRSAKEAEVLIAQTYLRHRPITDAQELRQVVAGITRMEPGEAQVRALESLGRHYVSDAEVLKMLTQLFAQTPSWSVQTAIAGILIRADRRSIAAPELLRTLVEKRQSSSEGNNMVDALIHRLQSP